MLQNKAAWWPWALSALLCYLLIAVFGRLYPLVLGSLWWGAAAYALWAALALGAIARRWPKWTAYGWRPATILLGALLSALAIFVRNDAPSRLLIDSWMTALIGIAVVTIIARFVPAALARRWFGGESSHGNSADPSR